MKVFNEYMIVDVLDSEENITFRVVDGRLIMVSHRYDVPVLLDGNATVSVSMSSGGGTVNIAVFGNKVLGE